VFVVNGRREFIIFPNADAVELILSSGDPWVESTFSAEAAQVPSRESRPIYLTDGFHCSDLLFANAALDPGVREVWRNALEIFPKWISEFTPTDAPQRSSSTPGMVLGRWMLAVAALVSMALL